MKRFAKFSVAICTVMALVMMTGSALPAGGGTPKVGDKAPAFEATDDQGKIWKSSDVVGKKIVVVYFYPADFTGGCTQQACGFRDDMQPLTEKGIEIVGVSGDSVKTHAAFKKEHNLTFTLLADGEGKVAEKFGVKFNKKQANAKFKTEVFVREGTASRTTAIIGMDGNIAALYTVSDAKGDSKKVLETVQKMKK